jgi:cyclase
MRHLRWTGAAALLALAAAPATAQMNWDTVQIRAERLTDNLHVLFGQGGNIGLSVGEDGAFVVDDQFAPLTPKILAAIAGLTPRPVRFVVNTHWHGDHTGGNENMAAAGALLVAHDNVRRRMNPAEFRDLVGRSQQAPKGALPVVTFTSEVTFHWNGETIRVFHVPASHTDGDAIIHFTRADVVHMGDTFFNGGYPFVDVSSGGNVNGIVAVADRVLAACRPGTIIIPGHGPVADCAALRRYRDVVATVRDRVRAEMQKEGGRTLEQLKAAGLSAEFDATWGRGFIRPDVFIELIYRSLGGR